MPRLTDIRLKIDRRPPMLARIREMRQQLEMAEQCVQKREWATATTILSPVKNGTTTLLADIKDVAAGAVLDTEQEELPFTTDPAMRLAQQMHRDLAAQGGHMSMTHRGQTATLGAPVRDTDGEPDPNGYLERFRTIVNDTRAWLGSSKCPTCEATAVTVARELFCDPEETSDALEWGARAGLLTVDRGCDPWLYAVAEVEAEVTR